MEKLLQFILTNITGLKKIKIEKEESDDVINLTIKPKAEDAGLIIGKNGNTIKAINRLVKVKATLVKKRVNIFVSP